MVNVSLDLIQVWTLIITSDHASSYSDPGEDNCLLLTRKKIPVMVVPPPKDAKAAVSDKAKAAKIEADAARATSQGPLKHLMK